EPREPGERLTQELDLLARELGQIHEDAGDVAARSGEARHDAGADRIALEVEGDDRNGRGELTAAGQAKRARKHQARRLEPDELREIVAAVLGGAAPVQLDVLALAVPELVEPLDERVASGGGGRHQADLRQVSG